ncbi:TIMELESS-interacting protein [Rhinophrynus dorsalis]
MLDPLENDIFDLPDYEHTEDEDFPPLPPPVSPGAGDNDAMGLRNGDDWAENAGQTQTEEAQKPARRAVKRPQPKLDAQRLTSQRGLPALRHMFDGVKFKGKGHEAEDLKALIRQMENWAHRLFPKLQFEDFINRLEFLGNKKEVQTCLKRIRMDMPIVHEDFTSEEVIVQMEDDDDLDLPSEHFPVLPERSPPPPLTQPSNMDLSEETLQRIERNRRLALEKRMAKMQSQSYSQAPASLPALSQSASLDTNEIPEDFGADLVDAVNKAVELTSQPAPSPVDTDMDPEMQSKTLPEQAPSPIDTGMNPASQSKSITVNMVSEHHTLPPENKSNPVDCDLSAVLSPGPESECSAMDGDRLLKPGAQSELAEH